MAPQRAQRAPIFTGWRQGGEDMGREGGSCKEREGRRGRGEGKEGLESLEAVVIRGKRLLCLQV